MSTQRQTVVLLGASNLTIGWAPVVDALQSGIHTNIDLYAAVGMGRSYVDWSRYFARSLPGIINCGLWKALKGGGYDEPTEADSQSPAPLVMLTDIGNDLVYRRTPQVISEAVDRCLTEIRHWRPDSRIIVTGLPLASLQTMSRTRFLIARTVLFPKSRLQLPNVLSDAAMLNQLVQTVAARHNACLVLPHDGWYGLDPIHIRRHLRRDAFQHIFEHWNEYRPGGRDLSETARPPLPEAAARIVFRKPRHAEQPVYKTDRLKVYAY